MVEWTVGTANCPPMGVYIDEGKERVERIIGGCI